jgi:hypothetical protein
MPINFWTLSFSDSEDQSINETRHSGDPPRTLWDKDQEAASAASPVKVIFDATTTREAAK